MSVVHRWQSQTELLASPCDHWLRDAQATPRHPSPQATPSQHTPHITRTMQLLPSHTAYKPAMYYKQMFWTQSVSLHHIQPSRYQSRLLCLSMFRHIWTIIYVNWLISYERRRKILLPITSQALSQKKKKLATELVDNAIIF